MHITHRYPQQPAIMFIVMSFFLVKAIYIYRHVYCVNTSLPEHAYYTAALCSTITILGYHHTSCTSTSAAKSLLRVSLPLFYVIVFWPFENLLFKWHFMDFMQRISQTRNETYFQCLHYTTLCFRKRR